LISITSKKSKTYAEAINTAIPYLQSFGHFFVGLLSGKQQQPFVLLVNPQKAQNSQQSTQLGYFFFAFFFLLKSIQHF